MIDAARAVAARPGATVPQVALAWLLAQPAVTSVITGARTEQQLTANLAASELRLTEMHAPCASRASARERSPAPCCCVPDHPGTAGLANMTVRGAGSAPRLNHDEIAQRKGVNMSALKNKTVLIVGRGSGIAGAIALAVREAGGQVIAAGRSPDELAEAYRGMNFGIERVDVTDESSVADLAGRVASVDHVVSTASARARGGYEDLTPGLVAASFAVKAIGPLLLAKHFAKKIPPDGSLLFMSGATALKPTPGMLAVAATNAAVDAVTAGLAVELAPVRVNAIAPGTIDTGAYDALGADRKAALFAARAAANPARRIGTADDIAAVALMALTSDFLTGVAIPVDGGEHLV